MASRRLRPEAALKLQDGNSKVSAGRLPPGRLIDLAYSAIHDDIMRCDLQPGAAVSEANLARRCGFGKTAVRAALLRLSQENLVTAQPRRGYEIVPITLRDVHEIFHLRGLLEPEAARLGTPHVDVEALRRLDTICAHGHGGQPAQLDVFLRANREFHLTLIEAGGNQRLTDLLRGVIAQMERLFRIGLSTPSRTAELRAEHTQLLAAVARRDAEAASQAAARHVETMRCAVIDAALHSRGVMAVNLSLGEAASAPRRAAPASYTAGF